jgi:L-fuculose-phosphate aldolase
VSKGFITPDSILLVNCAGEIIQGSGRASSEWSTHYKVYEQRADIGAVIHSHAPFATAFAVAGLALDLPVLPEMVYSLGAVPLVPYHLPGSNKLSEAIEPFVTRVNALLLKNHGVVTYGADLKEAFFCHESVEHAARIQIYAKLLGNIEVFNREEVAELKALRDQGGLTSPWYPVQV